ncbi:hypothetical protein [Clostridium formicaceticum]|nr:hypothetical protein [Clostridium formicaceticum]ARE89760.1 hypothetical protein CLFO_42410 [Clostridium formicaceticum]
MFTIDKSISTAYPGTKMGILVMKEVSCPGSYEEWDTAEFLDELQHRYGHFNRQELKERNPINTYVAYYKKFGQSYHLLAQLESVLKGKKSLNTKSGVLRAMFFSELESMLLTAGHDLSKLRLPLQLKIATGTEVYQSICGKEVTTVNGDMMLCDSSSTISSILRGPDYNSRITSATMEFLFSIYAPPFVDGNYIKVNLEKLEKRIGAFAPFSRTELLQVFS